MKFLASFVALSLFCTPAFSKVDVPTCTTHPSAQAFRDIIYSEDVAKAEEAARQMQYQYEAGQVASRDLRCSLFMFALMRPETARFSERWLKQYPGSPFAMVAQALALDRFSWAVRGNRLASETYPRALQEFQSMQSTAWNLAERAYEANPRILPASDALLHLANATGRRGVMRKIVDDVMARDPNDWTVEVYQSKIVKNWGATWDDVMWICSTWATRKPGADNRSEELCVVRGALGFPHTFDWAHAQLATDRFPELDSNRLQNLTWSNATRAQAEKALEILETFTFASPYASAYDGLALKYDLPYMTETLSRRGYDDALTRIEHEPFNPHILRLLALGIEYTIARPDQGYVETHYKETPTPEQILDYTHRRLMASPYNPDLWSHYEQAYRAVFQTDYHESEPFRINRVVYANHSPKVLVRYISAKMFRFNNISKARDGHEALTPEARERLLKIDRDKYVLCPFVRGYRLFQNQCSSGDDPGCDVEPQKAEIFEFLVNEAARKGVCQQERQSPIETLYFEPTPVSALPASQ